MRSIFSAFAVTMSLAVVATLPAIAQEQAAAPTVAEPAADATVESAAAPATEVQAEATASAVEAPPAQGPEVEAAATPAVAETADPADPEDAAAATTEADNSEVVKAPVPTTAGDQPFDFISEGKRIEIADKGFSLVPPAGWQVQTSHPKLTLVMQVPFEKGMGYQRTIQVAGFVGPKYMDDVTAKEFEDLIVREFSTALSAVQEFRVRNHMMVEMADGRDGILFYTEFKMEDVSLMQAHILVSSADRHFLLTFTDLAEHFENEEANEFLTEAWDSMTSVTLDTPAPMRFANFIYIGVAVGIVALLFGGIWFFNYVRSGRKYMDYASGKDLGDDPVSRQSTGMSGISNLSGVSRLESNMEGSNVKSLHQATKKGKKTAGHTGTGGYKTAANSDIAPLTKDDDDMAV